MSEHARLRASLRPQGMVAEGCRHCAFFDTCGGIEPERSLLDCFSLNCCRNETCDNVCPNNSHFVKDMQEIGGLRFDDVPIIKQHSEMLPEYIPTIHHGYSRVGLLNWPVVAIETYSLFHNEDGGYATIAKDALQLRQMFNLHADTKVVLRGTSKDPALERYWSRHSVDRPEEQLAQLGITCAIGPNFSHFLDVPRTDNLFNRKRQLICLSSLSSAGVSAVPHLSASMPADWEFWRKYLLLNETVSIVAIEFQTGNRKLQQATHAIDRAAQLQDRVGRRLHFIGIGAAQFVRLLVSRFDSFSIMDSMPFIKAIKRQRFEDAKRRPTWASDLHLPHTGVDELLDYNIASYSAWLKVSSTQPIRSRTVSH